MKNIIGLKEFRQNVDKYAKRAQKGESVVVTRRSKALFRISAVDEDDGKWETFIDFTKYRKGGIPAKELVEIMKSL